MYIDQFASQHIADRPGIDESSGTKCPVHGLAMILVQSSTAPGDAHDSMIIFYHLLTQTIWFELSSNSQPLLRFEPGTPDQDLIINN